MSKLINEFKNIHEGWEQSREAQDKINAAKTQIAEMLEKPQFRKFIVDKILANYRDDQIKMLEDRRKRRHFRSVSYNFRYLFQPCVLQLVSAVYIPQ